ncbi:cbb3-type cytochrome c oxidase N-terminal domain-containing protein [Lewinella cohaerens]|uniref:cbb3-type cytochrome c oxidase N-terminal domain-containing protein n=1 Tax=Lewinella cohaerens TaxID=70995 RepID=UPI0003737735|nr:cbb3-type cytochrome c oxidase N-terminal domain-containing protein [Lewinella cohaerens]
MKTNIIKFSLTFLLLCILGSAYANDAGTAQAGTSSDWLSWIFENLILIVGAIAVIGAVGAIFNLNNQLMELNRIRVLKEHGIEVAEKVAIQHKQSLWQRWYKDMTKAVPVEKEADVMLDHNYDGIRELDNILPPWWVGMFYATIIAGVVYFSYYHIADKGLSSSEQYLVEVEEAEEEVKAYLAMQSDQVDENTVVMLEDENELALGASIFINKCAVCHGAEGEGGVGPNMTDNYFLHGGSINDVFRTIKYGVPEKGMISWKSQLRSSDMQRVASYILTLVGNTPANPKAPEGELYQPTEEDEATEAADDQLGMNE